jgi:hypothetical protein
VRVQRPVVRRVAGRHAGGVRHAPRGGVVSRDENTSWFPIAAITGISRPSRVTSVRAAVSNHASSRATSRGSPLEYARSPPSSTKSTSRAATTRLVAPKRASSAWVSPPVAKRTGRVRRAGIVR